MTAKTMTSAGLGARHDRIVNNYEQRKIGKAMT